MSQKNSGEAKRLRDIPTEIMPELCFLMTRREYDRHLRKRTRQLLRSILRASAKNNWKRALAALEGLCTLEDEPVLEEGVTALEEAGRGTEVEKVLRRSLGAGPAVCNQWVAASARRYGLDWVGKKIKALARKHLARANVTVAYAEALADAGDKQRLREWVLENEALLRAETLSWGTIGACYSRIPDPESTIAWLSDWHERSGLEPWMLLNLTLALRGLDRFAEAAPINRFALEKLSSDDTSASHEVWLVLDDALAGNASPVEEYFLSHELNELDPIHRWIAALARAVLMTLTADDKEQALAEAHEHLAHTAAELEPIDRDQVFEIAYSKSIQRIALACGAAESSWERARLETPLMPKRSLPPSAP